MAIIWRKSSYSGGTSEQLNCVEVASLPTGLIGVRDSKNPDGPRLAVPVAAFHKLVRELKGRPRRAGAMRVPADQSPG